LAPSVAGSARSRLTSTPPTNRGVSYPLTHRSPLCLGPLVTYRWDWMQATIREPAEDVQAAVLAAFEGSWLERETARLGYADGFSIRDSEGRRAGLQSGGRNSWPNLAGTGADAPQVAAFLRSEFPRHEVTRCDSAADFDSPDAWERLSTVALQVADEHRLKVEHAGDWHRGEEGRTLYVGARSSGFRARIYEKGKEVRAKRAPGWEDVSLHAVRVEAQVRPDGAARLQAAHCSPVEAWGFARWGSDLLERVEGLVVPRYSIRDVRASNDERALDFMVRQYGAMLARQAEKGGGWENLGARLARLHGRNLARKEQS